MTPPPAPDAHAASRPGPWREAIRRETDRRLSRATQTQIVPINGGYSVKNPDGSFVGFAKNQHIAERIKSDADRCAAEAAELEAMGYSLSW